MSSAVDAAPCRTSHAPHRADVIKKRSTIPAVQIDNPFKAMGAPPSFDAMNVTPVGLALRNLTCGSAFGARAFFQIGSANVRTLMKATTTASDEPLRTRKRRQS
jgi:hypothetical protein